MQCETETPLKTLGEIAAELGRPIHQVQYAVRTNRIGETQRAGIIRLYGPDQIGMIRTALHRIAERRGTLL